MENVTELNQRRGAVQLALTTGLALLFLVALMWAVQGRIPAEAKRGILDVEGVTGRGTTQGENPATPGATPRYVATTGSDAGNDCTGQGSPCRTVEHAVAVASPGDVIQVAAGTYNGVRSHPAPPGYPWPPPGGLITQVVYVSKTVTIQGGYTTTNWTSADPEVNPTTLDAQGQGRVLFVRSGISPTLAGLRITGGDAAGLGGAFEDAGGGVYAAGATAVFSNSRIFDNSAKWGGGLYVGANGALMLFSSTVSTNTAEEGGGVYVNNSIATLDNCTVHHNVAAPGGGPTDGASPAPPGTRSIGPLGAPGSGGAIAAWVRSTLTISNSQVISNTAERGGGGGVLLNESRATLYGCTVAGNTASFKGGGVHLWYNSAVVLDRSTLAGNAANEGAGLLLGYQSAATLTNNIIADNEASSTGGGLSILGCSSHLLHNTIVENRAGDGSGIYATDYPAGTPSTVALTNTIVADHTVGIRVTAGSTATLESTLWHDNTTDWSGAGAIQRNHDYWGDPVFVDPSTGNYHIGLASAALDKGVETTVDIDIDGDPRPGGLAADIGADEWTGFGIFLPLIFRDSGP